MTSSPHPSASADPRFRILFVLGLGRSGSTLLGRLLGNHSRVANAGELLRLEETLDNPESKCACGLPVNGCPDWNRLLLGVPEKVRKDYRKWTPALMHTVRENAGASVLVDVSKTRGYRLAKRWRNPEVGYILLLRDPRGILRTHVAEGRELAGQLKLQKKWINRYGAFARKHPGRCFVMHYEDLMTSPEEVMRSLCGFIGIDFQPAMISPDSEVSHMALYSGSPYMKGSGELRLDERWRQEMSPGDIARISAALKSVAIYNNRYRLDETARFAGDGGTAPGSAS